jgi:hypothetical protein
MEYSEAKQLIRSTAEDRGIGGLMTDQYDSSLFEESEGHPYVIKVLLGDVAKARRLVPVRRISGTKSRYWMRYSKDPSQTCRLSPNEYFLLCAIGDPLFRSWLWKRC